MKVDEFGRPTQSSIWRPCRYDGSTVSIHMSWCAILKHKRNDRGQWLHKLAPMTPADNRRVGLPSEILYASPGSKWHIERLELDVRNGWGVSRPDADWMIIADRNSIASELFIHWQHYTASLWSPWLRVVGEFEPVIEEDEPLQPAPILHSLIMQDYWWHTQDGRWLKVSTMPLKHAINLMAYLMRNARNIQHRYVFSSVWNNAPDEVDHEVALEAGKSDEQFIRDLPLWQALEKRIIEGAGEQL